ncbi:MAG: AAA family ATPase, partial [Acidimicrobiales bacterium]
PEAQLDRFLLRVAPGYPTLEEEDAMLRRFGHDDPFARLTAVSSATEIVALQERRQDVGVGGAVRGYLLEIVRSTRRDPRVSLGASPRAALALLRAAQARALLDGRTFALPDDVKALASSVLTHRLVLRPEARLRGDGPAQVVDDVLSATPVPVEDEPAG